MARIARAALVLMLLGCTAEKTPDKGIPGGVCLEQGGTVVTGMAGPTCARPTPDAGKACTSARDCSGHCLAQTMTCSALTPIFGCFEVGTEDGHKVGLCVD